MEQNTKLFHLEENTLSSVVQAYNRTEQSLAEDVKNFKKWMQLQHNLPEILEEAKVKIDMYYTFRSQVLEIVGNMNPNCSNIKEMANLMHHVPLPKLTKDMYRVFVSKCRTKDKVGQIEPYDVLKMAANLQEIRLKEDIMFRDIFIFDIEGTCMSFLSKLTPNFAGTAITLYQKIYSLLVQGVYIINTVPYVSTLLAIAKTFLKPKIIKRIHVCKDTSILKEHFSSEILPKDYGGTEKSVEELHELCQLKFQDYRDRFNLLDELRVNENLRPTRLANENDELLGYHGKFKKLDID
ncbi:hypothetical protein Zmor_013293 [Zophobas morio]|uniref:CRAL-TRIO domain-containing protein n=1 Tax=Zophobas morio TaxID=2755281 RepID=A0AA38MEH7_9CUCU|nr:hypothetical protein Zmor_013293 [Zophobas morio]